MPERIRPRNSSRCRSTQEGIRQRQRHTPARSIRNGKRLAEGLLGRRLIEQVTLEIDDLRVLDDRHRLAMTEIDRDAEALVGWRASSVRSPRSGQVGRSGRRGQSAPIVLIARDDPLDTYLVHHPAALLDKPIERVVIDPANCMCWARNCCARPPNCRSPTPRCEPGTPRRWPANWSTTGLPRRRPSGLHPRVDPHHGVDIRGGSGGQIAILEDGTGRMLRHRHRAGARRGFIRARSICTRARRVSGRFARFLRGRHRVRPRRGSWLHHSSAREVTDIQVTGYGERKTFGRLPLALCRCRSPTR